MSLNSRRVICIRLTSSVWAAVILVVLTSYSDVSSRSYAEACTRRSTNNVFGAIGPPQVDLSNYVCGEDCRNGRSENQEGQGRLHGGSGEIAEFRGKNEGMTVTSDHALVCVRAGRTRRSGFLQLEA